MQEDLRAILVDDPAVSALLIFGGTSRIYWNAIPQASPDPNCVLYEIAEVPSYTMEAQDGLVPTRVQADCRGTTYASALAVARAVRVALSGFRGTKGGTDFRAILQIAGRAYSEKPGTQGAPGILYHVVSTDFDVWASSAP